jgi:hypothetical protein
VFALIIAWKLGWLVQVALVHAVCCDLVGPSAVLVASWSNVVDTFQVQV